MKLDLKLDERICDVCLGYIPDRQGLICLEYGLFVHRDVCGGLVLSLEVDYSRSKRGRRRTPKEMDALVAQYREWRNQYHREAGGETNRLDERFNFPAF